MLSSLKQTPRPMYKILVVVSPTRFDSHWPRPDPTPPKVIPASRLVPPYMRGLYLKHAYYPEYKVRADDVAIEGFNSNLIQFILFHAVLFGAFALYYFLYHRWLPKPLTVFL